MKKKIRFIGMVAAIVAAILWITKPPANARACFGHSIAKGATKVVAAGNYVDGDVTISGVSYVGKRIFMQKSAAVSAPFGASYIVSGCQGKRNAPVIKWPSQVQTNAPAAPAPAAPTKTPAKNAKALCVTVPLQPGANLIVPSGMIVEGDVALNGQKLYDNDPGTALRVVLNQPALLFAEWGATLSPKGCEQLLTKTTNVVFWNGGPTPAPVTTVAPTQPPAPKPTTAAPTPTTVPCPPAIPIANGATVTVPEGYVIDGDVFADGVKLFDDDSNTALRVTTAKNTTVNAPYGATYFKRGCEPAPKPNTVFKTW